MKRHAAAPAKPTNGARFPLSLRRWWSIVLKEFLQLRRDRVTFGMIVGLPIVQLMLFGFAINTDPRQLTTAVIAADQSEFTRSFVAGMQATTYFNVVGTLPDEAAGRHQQAALLDIRGVGEVRAGAAVRGHGINVVALVAALVLQVVKRASVGRDRQSLLNIIRLGQLNRPAAVRVRPPDIVPAGEVGGNEQLLAVGAPAGVEHTAREDQSIDGNRGGLRIGRRNQALGIGHRPLRRGDLPARKRVGDVHGGRHWADL